MYANTTGYDILTGKPLNNMFDEGSQQRIYQAYIDANTPSPWSAYYYMIFIYLVGLLSFSIALNCKEKHRATFIVGFCAIGMEIIRYCSGQNMAHSVKDTIIKVITIQCMGSVVMVLREKFVLTEEQKRLPWGRRAIATYKALWNARFVGTARPAPTYQQLEETSNEKTETNPARKEEQKEAAIATNAPMHTAECSGAPMSQGIKSQAWMFARRYAVKTWYSTRLRFILATLAHLLIIVLIDNFADVVASRYIQFGRRDIADYKRSIVRRYFRGDQVDLREVVVRSLFAFQSVWGAYNWYNRMHLLSGLLFVSIGIDNPEDWLPAFGSIRQAWSVRRFWSKYFDRITYRAVNGWGEIFMEYGGFGQRPYRGKKRWVLNGFVFAISGVFHAYTSYLAGARCGFWMEVGWWMGNYFAIVGETVFLWALHTYCPRLYNAMSGKIGKAIGFCWVFVWLWWSVPKTQYQSMKCMDYGW